MMNAPLNWLWKADVSMICRRWKIAHTEMMRYQKSGHYPEKPLIVFINLRTEKETGVRNFTAPKNYWLAIPQDQIEVNPNLVQNPGY